ncbi:Hypothetical predicted protein [Mytilus galloprovincialis]|uniref:Integrase catalytic domain-containing protein n=1 Tax=Mytilus galloprovincialis TaxID=29158 RepID=A0A8B6GU96_MYTGA|nr:Hypothetical predicted protein [Mytilus galloprovincialis]
MTIDIRVWENATKPTREGINLPLLRWQSICDNLQNINDAIQHLKQGVNLRLHIGKDVFVCVNSDYLCINIRQFLYPPNETILKPAKKGITLSLPEWKTLIDVIPQIEKAVPEVKTMIPCWQTHDNQEGLWNCSECFGHCSEYLNNISAERRKVCTRKKKIRKWLETQETFGLHRQVNRKFPRAQVISPYIDYQWDVDTAVLTTYTKDNDGYAYFVLAIDVFSRFIWTKVLRSTKGAEMRDTLESIFREGRKPTKFRSDKGVEYKNRRLQDYSKKEV